MIVTILPYFGPRKSEKTFPVKAGSISNAGRKQTTIKNKGFTGFKSSKAA